jgi:hypothetical protein
MVVCYMFLRFCAEIYSFALSIVDIVSSFVKYFKIIFRIQRLQRNRTYRFFVTNIRVVIMFTKTVLLCSEKRVS